MPPPWCGRKKKVAAPAEPKVNSKLAAETNNSEAISGKSATANTLNTAAPQNQSANSSELNKPVSTAVPDIEPKTENQKPELEEPEQGSDAMQPKAPAAQELSEAKSREQSDSGPKTEDTTAATAPSPPTATRRRLGATSGISLKKAEQKKVITEDEEPTFAHHSIDPKQLQEAWDKVLTSFTDPQLLGLISGKLPEVKDGGILFPVDNLVHQKTFEDKRELIAGPLMKIMNLQGLRIETEIREKEKGERKPYSPKEKFEFLANKNPILWQVRDMFDLDLGA